MNAATPKPFVFVLMPFMALLDDIYELGIKPACIEAGTYCERVDKQLFNESILERIYNQVTKADIIIADMTGRNPNVFYEVGYAHALNKQVILLTQDANDIPFDLKHYPHIVYGGKIAVLKTELERRVRWCVENVSKDDSKKYGSIKEKGPKSLVSEEVMPKSEQTVHSPQVNANHHNSLVRSEVFISYSHKDIKWLSRLQIHLKPLEQVGAVKRWDDTLIDPGTEWREAIRIAVASAKVAVLLVSADFLASDFISTNELPPLLAAAKAEGAVVLPVIVSPCRFEKIKNLSQFKSVNPPSQPLIKMSRNRQEELFVKVTEAIEVALRS